MQLRILILSLIQGPMGYFLLSSYMFSDKKKKVSKCFGTKLISF